MQLLEYFVPFAKDAAKAVKRISLKDFKEVAGLRSTSCSHSNTNRIIVVKATATA